MTLPPGVVRTIFPVVAPVGTMKVNPVADVIVYCVTVTPLRVITLTPARFVPTRVTVPPTEAPYVGLVLVIVDVSAVPVTVNELALVPVPPAVTTEIVPEVALLGTAVRMEVALNTVYFAETPLNFTDVAPAKFVPVNVTASPTAPELTERAVTVGFTNVEL